MSIKNGHDVAGVRAAGCRQRLTACSRCEFVMVRVRRVEAIKTRTSTERSRDLRKRKHSQISKRFNLRVRQLMARIAARAQTGNQSWVVTDALILLCAQQLQRV